VGEPEARLVNKPTDDKQGEQNMATDRVIRNGNGEFVDYNNHRFAIPLPNQYKSTRPHFETQAEMTKAMRNPRYQTDEGYRQHVATMIQNSDAVELGLEQRSVIDGGDKVEAIKEWATQAFKDPRYKTSALFREQVKEAIRQDPLIDQVFVQPLHPMGKGMQRFQVEPEITGPEAPVKPRFNQDNPANEDDSEE
jgi:hypothetical protein